MYSRACALTRRIFSSFPRIVVGVFAVGLLLGTLFAAGTDVSLYPLMRRVILAPVSIVFPLFCAVLPFLMIAYAVTIHRLEILLATVFCKAFCFAFLSLTVCHMYGSAGWLIQPMVQFSDWISMPFLIWFSLRNKVYSKDQTMHDHILCVSVAVIASLIHYFVVLPFLAQLIH